LRLQHSLFIAPLEKLHNFDKCEEPGFAVTEDEEGNGERGLAGYLGGGGGLYGLQKNACPTEIIKIIDPKKKKTQNKRAEKKLGRKGR